mmetsp:Transcript_43948/g.110380  ORF Transcript_43948/g.110380 Transcript_43948/m.110380 type:complete len:239 (-) Transcript_43948:30-746(-)
MVVSWLTQSSKASSEVPWISVALPLATSACAATMLVAHVSKAATAACRSSWSAWMDVLMLALRSTLMLVLNFLTTAWAFTMSTVLVVTTLLVVLVTTPPVFVTTPPVFVTTPPAESFSSRASFSTGSSSFSTGASSFSTIGSFSTTGSSLLRRAWIVSSSSDMSLSWSLLRHACVEFPHKQLRPASRACTWLSDEARLLICRREPSSPVVAGAAAGGSEGSVATQAAKKARRCMANMF